MYPKFISTIVLIIVVLIVQGQKNEESYFLFDSAWKSTTVVADARYFARAKPSGDSCAQWDIYRVHGPLIRIETNKKDENGTAHGRYSWYDQQGYIDSLGNYTNGIIDGDWYYYNDTGKLRYQREFSMGKLVWEKDYSKDTSPKEYELEEGEEKSEFKGGRSGWQRFLNKNLTYPQGAIDRNIEGVVRVRFTVNTDGTVQDP
jgi:antitoxin component YwqK of YwqJK toxin-antitoxin module